MTFQQLAYVAEIFKCGSINKAAHQLGLSQSGISAAVRYLHSPSSVADVGDLEPMLRLTRLFLNAMAGELEEDGYGAV